MSKIVAEENGFAADTRVKQHIPMPRASHRQIYAVMQQR